MLWWEGGLVQEEDEEGDRKKAHAIRFSSSSALSNRNGSRIPSECFSISFAHSAASIEERKESTAESLICRSESNDERWLRQLLGRRNLQGRREGGKKGQTVIFEARRSEWDEVRIVESIEPEGGRGGDVIVW